MAVDDGRVVSNFIVQALRNQPIAIYGDGTQTLSFCYVSDLIDAICRTMNTEGLTEEQGYSFSHVYPAFVREADRVLKPEGILLCKITDYIHNHQYQWAHVDFIQAARHVGFTACDCIIKTRKGPSSIRNGRWLITPAASTATGLCFASRTSASKAPKQSASHSSSIASRLSSLDGGYLYPQPCSQLPEASASSPNSHPTFPSTSYELARPPGSSRRAGGCSPVLRSGNEDPTTRDLSVADPCLSTFGPMRSILRIGPEGSVGGWPLVRMASEPSLRTLSLAGPLAPSGTIVARSDAP